MPSCSLQLCGGSIQHGVYRWLSWQLSGSDVVLYPQSRLAIQKEKWDVIVLNVNAHTRGAPFAHRCLEPMHPLTATK